MKQLFIFGIFFFCLQVFQPVNAQRIKDLTDVAGVNLINF